MALSWALQSGVIILPRSSDSGRIRENLRGFVGEQLSSPPEDGTRSAREDRAKAATLKGSDSDNGGDGVSQGCATGGGDVTVNVFLTDDDVRAIDRLDGTIGS